MQIKNNNSSIGSPKSRLPIKYLSLNHQTPFAVNQTSHAIKNRATIIEESKKVNLTPVLERFKYLTKYFPENVIVMHGNLKNEEKNIVMKNFLENTGLKVMALMEQKMALSNTALAVPHDLENSQILGLAEAILTMFEKLQARHLPLISAFSKFMIRVRLTLVRFIITQAGKPMYKRRLFQKQKRFLN